MTLGMQDTLHALADPTRREILNLLKQSRLSAGEISNHFSISGAAISRHLSVLKDADLIRNEREGKFIYYELNATVLEEILLWISELKEGMIMIRQNKKLLLLTSVITLLPVFIGLFLWNQLPDSVATHFGLNNQPDGYSSKAFAVFGLPLILLAVHLVCVVATKIDPKSKDINKKIFRVLLWICPLVSLFVSTVIYGYSLGYDFDMSYLCGILIGVLYLVLGNFLPTVKPNYTIGFRIPWTLNDPDNWYHTHRFGGKCMVIGGIIMILTSPLQNMWILLAAAIVPCLLPAIYSYLYYRKS